MHGNAAKQGGWRFNQRVLELAGITAFFAGTPLVILQIAESFHSQHVARPWVLIGAGLLVSLLFADFISGFVHWSADNWGSPKWPLIGPGFIEPFRHHHVDPQAMTRHDFVETNGNNCLISLPAMYLAYSAAVNPASATDIFTAVFWLGVCYWVLGTNQFHAWAHTERPPRAVRLLQRWRLILTVEHHQQHHMPPHNRNYCITNGWLNPLLRWMRFFEILEWLMLKATGVRPQHAQITEHGPATEAAPSR